MAGALVTLSQRAQPIIVTREQRRHSVPRASEATPAEGATLDGPDDETGHAGARLRERSGLRCDGHLHVRQTNVSKAMVCPYYGHEIPGFQELGLDAHKVYHLLRDPRELEKAAHTFNGKPLLYGHNPVSAEDHDHARTVGSVSGAAGIRRTSRWTCRAGRGRRSTGSTMARPGRSRRATATPRNDAGTYQGVRYDGRMTNLSGNHVALVPKGRPVRCGGGRRRPCCDRSDRLAATGRSLGQLRHQRRADPGCDEASSDTKPAKRLALPRSERHGSDRSRNHP